MLVERPHARFAGVAGDDLFDDLRCEDQLLLLDAVRLALFGQQVVQGDLDLVFEDVARDVDHLHAVAQRRIDIADVVGRGDEEHLREVVLRIEVVVVERGVLFGIEYFEQCARRIAVVRHADLVHLVEDDDRVRRSAPLDRLYDPARHRPDVGAAVAANLRFVVQAAQCDAAELTPQRRCDRFAQRGLAYARRAVETEDRRFEVALQLDDRQVFQQPLLDLFEAEMVVVELLARLFEVEIVLRTVVPRQFEQQLQVGCLHRIFGYGGVEPFEFLQLLLEEFGHLLGPVLLLGLFAHLVQFGVGAVAQFVLDGAHLLLEVVVALLLVDLLLDLLLDLVLQLDELLVADQDFE